MEDEGEEGEDLGEEEVADEQGEEEEEEVGEDGHVGVGGWVK